VGLVRGHSTVAAQTNRFGSGFLKIKRLPVLILVPAFVAMAAFYLTGCIRLQLLNATLSHRGHLRSRMFPMAGTRAG
jgi:hypothetical protein